MWGAESGAEDSKCSQRKLRSGSPCVPRVSKWAREHPSSQGKKETEGNCKAQVSTRYMLQGEHAGASRSLGARAGGSVGGRRQAGETREPSWKRRHLSFILQLEERWPQEEGRKIQAKSSRSRA